ncbi:GDSL-type esterase/lipase family protein [Nocardioides pacificus]
MLVGDSLTIGSAGDWTWRYRLDRHLRRAGVDFDLVGPRSDLFDNVRNRHGSSAYNDPDFSRSHHAQWGQALRDVPARMAEVAAAHRPDIVVVLLGTNDLLFLSRPPGVIEDLRRLVTQARAATPEAGFVLAEPPHSDRAPERELAELLPELVTTLASERSPVTIAHTSAGFTQDDTWDGTHPHAGGEVKLAAAVADALAGLGVGTPHPRPLRLPRLGPRTAGSLAAIAGERRVTLRLRSAPGVDREVVWQRDATRRAGWCRLGSTSSGTWVADDLTAGHLYDFRTQPAKGRLVSQDVRSAVVSARPHG